MPSTAQFLEGLRNKRLKWIDANRENNFEQGILNLLTELYPEQAHFIFELFQNAEDALASSINFKLNSDRLIVTHNGKRQFDEKDVESITSIGQSTKKDDLNQIGKFGVGFKAVFSYTATPIVHSGDFNFEIKDLVCPHTVAKPVLKNGHTQFIFPFNNPNKNSQKCFEEVAKGLVALQDNVLLFLNNIDEICWDIEGRGKGRLARQSRNDDVIEIKNESSSKSPNSSTYWLRFQKNIPDKESLFVGVAYRLDYIDELQPFFDQNTKISKSMKIIPLDGDGQLSIYFPAEKEVTKLKFHIHGPYASTVARDSVKYDHEGNLELIDLTAQLIAESLHKIKAHGLITTDFLAVLPNDKDDLNDFYQPILEAVTDEFKNHKLLPGQYAKYIDATSAKDGPADIKNIINDGDLAVFCGNADVKWAKAAKQKNSRSDNFLESLEIEEWGWEDLAETMRNGFVNRIHPSAKSWLLSKTDDWMQKFYFLLDHLIIEKKYDYRVSPSTWKIIRTADGTHLTGKEVFFPNTDPNNLKKDKFPRLKAEILNLQGKSKRQLERAEHFLREAGVSEVGEEQELQLILEAYYAPESKDPSDKQHVEHVNRFITFWVNTKNADLFNKFHIFKNVSGNSLYTPTDLFIDKPFIETGLSGFYSALSALELEEANDKVEIWHGYNKFANFIGFALAVGVSSSLQIIKKYIDRSHPEYLSLVTGFNGAGWSYEYGINDDYTIGNLEHLLALKNKEVSRAIWRTMCSAETKALKARYRPNSRCSAHFSLSTLAHLLKTAEWIPSADGSFHKPEDICNEMLPEGFSYDRDEWLTSIDFAKTSRTQSEEFRQKKEVAEKLGISLELTEYLQQLTNDEQKAFLSEFISWRDKKNTPHDDDDLPNNTAPDPNRRYKKAEEEAEEAEQKQYEKKERSVRTNRNPEVKSYLKEFNTNDNGNVVCQICCKKMPFKIGGSEDYFESVQCIKSVKKDFKPNHLALCPNCAAEYKFACETSEPDRIEFILLLDHIQDSDLIVPLQMPVHDRLRFTQKHLIELQAVLQHINENSDDIDEDEDLDDEDALEVNITQDITSKTSVQKSKADNEAVSSLNSDIPKSPEDIATIDTRSDSVKKHEIKKKVEPIIIYKKKPVTSAPSQSNPTNSSQYNSTPKSTTSIPDKRIERAISGMNKLASHENQKVLIKGKEVVLKLINYEEYRSILKTEGISLASLKMALDYLVPGFDHKKLGFKKFVEFIKHVSASTNAAVYVMPTNEAVLGLKNQKIQGANLHL